MLISLAVIGIFIIKTEAFFIKHKPPLTQPRNKLYTINIMAPSPALLRESSSTALPAVSTLSPKSVTALNYKYKNETMDTYAHSETTRTTTERPASEHVADLCPFKKVMAANRGEIATRINRAATELNLDTVSLYAYEGEYIYIKHVHKITSLMYIALYISSQNCHDLSTQIVTQLTDGIPTNHTSYQNLVPPSGPILTFKTSLTSLRKTTSMPFILAMVSYQSLQNLQRRVRTMISHL